MAVITVSRQVGSWGTEIAREAARQLGYDFADKERMEKLLAEFGFPEPKVEKYDEKRPHFWDSFTLERKKFLHSTRAAIYDLASKDREVIVGRGGQVLLKDVPGTFHLRVICPFAERVRRLASTVGFDEKQAARFLHQSDHDSSGFIHSFFNVEWDDPSLYDLVLNTAKVSLETGVQMVVLAARSPEIASQEEKAREKLADLALEQRVEARLMDILGTHIRQVEVEVEKGVVTLRGSVDSAQGREACEQALSALKNVRQVQNRLSVSRNFRYGV